jgi:transposase
VRVYLCLTACDIRKSFDSLHALVREHLELDAYAGHLFVAASRRRDRVKILEEGTYAAPFSGEAGEKRREITAQELGALLSGIDLDRAEKRKRPETMS